MDIVTDIRGWERFLPFFLVSLGFWGCLLSRLDEACECGYTSGCAVLCERGARNSRERGVSQYRS